MLSVSVQLYKRTSDCFLEFVLSVWPFETLWSGELICWRLLGFLAGRGALALEYSASLQRPAAVPGRPDVGARRPTQARKRPNTGAPSLAEEEKRRLGLCWL